MQEQSRSDSAELAFAHGRWAAPYRKLYVSEFSVGLERLRAHSLVIPTGPSLLVPGGAHGGEAVCEYGPRDAHSAARAASLPRAAPQHEDSQRLGVPARLSRLESHACPTPKPNPT